jgi:hypothetical protein
MRADEAISCGKLLDRRAALDWEEVTLAVESRPKKRGSAEAKHRSRDPDQGAQSNSHLVRRPRRGRANQLQRLHKSLATHVGRFSESRKLDARASIQIVIACSQAEVAIAPKKEKTALCHCGREKSKLTDH